MTTKAHVALLTLLCVGVTTGETLRASKNVERSALAALSYGYLPSDQCYLYDIEGQSFIKTLDQTYNEHYEIADTPFHRGYSIKCDFAPSKFESMVWHYNGRSQHLENYHGWWMNGDNNGLPAAVPWLGQPGHKTIEVVGYKHGRVVWRNTFYLEAKLASKSSCSCQSDYDCLYNSYCPKTSKCLYGNCVNQSPPPPTCRCWSDNDCLYNTNCPNKCGPHGQCVNPLPPPPPTCRCWSDNDCIYNTNCPNKCGPHGQCVNPPPPPPPTSTCRCWSDKDCIYSKYCPNKCGQYGQCVSDISPVPVPAPRPFPVPVPVPAPRPFPVTVPRPFPVPVPVTVPRPFPVPVPRPFPVPVPVPVPMSFPVPIPNPPPVPSQTIPNDRQVRSLIRLLDQAVVRNKAIAPQWLRLAFHDAGTFNTRLSVGGANGCLLTHPPMRRQDENLGLDLALETLQTAKMEWGVPAVSSADVIQFAGFFTAVRQRGTPGLTTVKESELVGAFEWGRPDERNCRIEWTENLPAFEFLGADVSDIPGRCLFAGSEIKEKMMDRNGFTAFEATALIGAHTIGVTRNVFGLANDPLDPTDNIAPWSSNGHDNATPEGAVFDNGYHSFLANDIVANTVQQFQGDDINQAPFDLDFGSWFRDSRSDINQLDTDIALAFPSQNTGIHPHFNSFTEAFANDNQFFIISFMEALNKMSRLGVTAPLSPAALVPFFVSGGGGAQPESTRGGPAFDSAIDTSITVAEQLLEQNEINRAGEIALLTTPI